MATVCPNNFQTEGAVIVALDQCGAVQPGSSVYAAPGDFIDLTIGAEVTTGDTVSTDLANGQRCRTIKLPDNLDNYTLEATFCSFDPGLAAAIANAGLVTRDGDTVGATFKTGQLNSRWALIIWLKDAGGACLGGDPVYTVVILANLHGGYLLPTVVNATDPVDWTLTGIAGFDDEGLIAWLNSPNGILANLTQDVQGLDDNPAFAVYTTTTPPPASFCGTEIIPSELTGVTAGTPGSFQPTGAIPPANLAQLVALGALGQTTTAWDTSQYVVLGDGTDATWDGTEWEIYTVPAVPTGDDEF